MSEAETKATQPNLVEQMTELRDTYLQTWSKYLIEEVNSESYAQASGAALSSYLDAAAPFKEPAEQAMLKTLQQLHMPTSADFAGLAGRFTNLEMQLDNMDAKLDRLEKLLIAAAKTAEAKTAEAKTAEAKPAAAKPAEARTPAEPAAHAAPIKQASKKQSKHATAAKAAARKPRKGTK